MTSHQQRSLENTILDRIHEESATLQQLGRSLEGIGRFVENNDDHTPDIATHVLEKLRNAREVIATAELKYKNRCEALQTERDRLAIAAAESSTVSVS